MVYPDSYFFPALLLLALISCTLVAANPADELAAKINQKRRDAGQPNLAVNEGLACIALQYLHQYQQSGNPPQNLIDSTYVNNCGVQEFMNPAISRVSSLSFCQSSYLSPSDAFTQLASENSEGAMQDSSFKEIGVAVDTQVGDSPFNCWVVFLSDASPSSSYVLTNSLIVSQYTGCISGSTLPCSVAGTPPSSPTTTPSNATPHLLIPPRGPLIFTLSLFVLLALKL